MKKKIISMIMALVLGLSLTACGDGGSNEATSGSKSGTSSEKGSSTVANKDKPLVWFNRQPSNSSTGELDQTALNFNKDTYYVGFDANQGAELQGTMVKEYIEKNIDKIDRNGDGVIGYVLAIGDIGHNDSIAHTRGVRKALGTGVEKDGDINSEPVDTNTDGSTSAVQAGKLEIGGKEYAVRELASQEMKNSAGATWDAATAGNAIGTWSSSFGKEIDIVVSNNDGMGMSMFNAWSKEQDVPTFGYDANNDAVAAIADGYGGTISQHADVQAYLTLRILRNALDGVDIDTVMGLMGENGARKSTMMKCLFGTYQKDEGKILLDGKEVSFSGPKDALENGIAMVHQELNQCLEGNVIDNLFLGRYPVNSMGVVDEGRMKKEASELFRKLGMTVNLTQPMKNMSVSQGQMCEIAKAISYHSKVIVLDEPTSSLMAQEVDKLFQMMRMLKEQGIALIYISHKMDEIFEICDQISVLRDGNLVMTKDSKDTNMNELIAAMVGRSLENRFPPVDNKPKDVILSIQHLSTKFEPHLQDITFDVKEGEIFGLYGLVGAGRTELLETIFGVRTRAAGRVYFNNRLMNFSNAREAMDHGFAMITEERKANGLFLKGDLTFNTTIANLNQYKSGLALSDSKMVKATAKEIKIMHTKCMGPEDMISSLSGGNQQKVIMGKWLERSPQIFMMDEPTRGIDVGAKYEIYELIINMAKQGKTIIVVSSEMPEILGITNRIGVMSNGHLSGIVNTKETDQEELLRLSAKYL